MLHFRILQTASILMTTIQTPHRYPSKIGIKEAGWSTKETVRPTLNLKDDLLSY